MEKRTWNDKKGRTGNRSADEKIMESFMKKIENWMVEERIQNRAVREREKNEKKQTKGKVPVRFFSNVAAVSC